MNEFDEVAPLDDAADAETISEPDASTETDEVVSEEPSHEAPEDPDDIPESFVKGAGEPPEDPSEDPMESENTAGDITTESELPPEETTNPPAEPPPPEETKAPTFAGMLGETEDHAREKIFATILSLVQQNADPELIITRAASDIEKLVAESLGEKSENLVSAAIARLSSDDRRIMHSKVVSIVRQASAGTIPRLSALHIIASQIESSLK